MAHASLGASGADRWMRCPGSITLSKRAPVQRESIYAAEGSAAHKLGEICLQLSTSPFSYLGGTAGREIVQDPRVATVPDGKTTFEITEGMCEAVQVYVDEINRIREVAGPYKKEWIEHRFSLDPLDPPEKMFGTSDFTLYSPEERKLYVVDYKHGVGYAVEAVGNPQGRYYGLGAALMIKDPIDEVEIVIVQPRAIHSDGPIRRDTVEYLDLLDWSADLMDAARLTQDPNAPLMAGRWCKFCPAATICPELEKKALEDVRDEFDDLDAPPASTDLTLDRIGTILQKAEMLEGWLKALRQRALEALEAGEEVPGWKLVEKRATRKWINPVDAENFLTEELGEDAYAPKKVITPPQAEKILGKAHEGLKKMYTAESSGVTLAPSTSSKPAALPPAQRDFEALD